VHINVHISNSKAKEISKCKCCDFKIQEKASAGSDAETKKLKAEVEELKGKLQLSAEEVAKLKSRCAALSDLADQVFATRHPMCMFNVNVSFYKDIIM